MTEPLLKETKVPEITAEGMREVRAELGMTQTELGVALGFTAAGARRSVCELESGRRPINGTLQKVMQYIRLYGLIED